LLYALFIGIFHASNVTIRGSGLIDGHSKPWWENCTKCHYIGQQVGNESLYCLTAGRPKLIQAQFVNGFSMNSRSDKNVLTSTPLTGQFTILDTDSSLQSNDSHIQFGSPSPSDEDGQHQCRNSISQQVDGIALKSGLNGFGLNLGIPTGNVVWINNITTKGRKGL
jgi:hypothetical protein